MYDHVIGFNIPYINGTEIDYVKDAIQRNSFSGNGFYTKLCEDKLEKLTGTPKCLLTSSCSHALDMCASLIEIKPGDEVIMASFNFVSAANAFVSRGAKICFVDIDPQTMNIEPSQIEAAINEKTKAVLVMHYGGNACEMDAILEITKKNGLYLIEDAAHCIGAYFQDKHLGSIGDLGTFSFHATKNIHCGEGGALLVNNESLIDRAEVIREKGTNRKAFLEGQVDKYSWVDIGSSYLMSDLSAAFLYGQLCDIESVSDKRAHLFKNYFLGLSGTTETSRLNAENSSSNSHLFYLKTRHRKKLISYLSDKNIKAHFHYTPLHSSLAGKRFGYFFDKDQFTTKESEHLLRLPLYASLTQQEYIINQVLNFFNEELN